MNIFMLKTELEKHKRVKETNCTIVDTTTITSSRNYANKQSYLHLKTDLSFDILVEVKQFIGSNLFDYKIYVLPKYEENYMDYLETYEHIVTSCNNKAELSGDYKKLVNEMFFNILQHVRVKADYINADLKILRK